MHKLGQPSDLMDFSCILNTEPLCSNICIHSVCSCQILFDSFVQANKRLFPNISLVFSRGVNYLLGGVYQSQQGTFKVILMQVTMMIWKVRDERKYVC